MGAHCATIKALTVSVATLRGRAVAELAALLPLLPLVKEVSGLNLDPWSADIPAADMHANLDALLRACSSLMALQLWLEWRPELPEHVLCEQLLHGQHPAGALQLFGNMTSLESLDVCVSDDSPAAKLSLEAFVRCLRPLTRLRSLAIGIRTEEDILHVLPACVSLLVNLRELELFFFKRLMCAPGWAELPQLESLKIDSCGVGDDDGERVFPGIAGLSSLSKLVITEPYDAYSTFTLWPSALWHLTRLQVLQHSERDYYSGDPDLPPPPRAELPAGWSQFQGLRDLDLSGQEYVSFPTVITHITTLTRLCMTGGCFEALPAGFTALEHLADLALGHPACGEPGVLDVQALGCLSAFPRLTLLRFSICAVVFSADFADAAHRPAFKSFVLENAYAAAASRAAVLVYALKAKEQGRGFALSMKYGPGDVPGARKQEVSDFCAFLEAGGLPREDYLLSSA